LFIQQPFCALNETDDKIYNEICVNPDLVHYGQCFSIEAEFPPTETNEKQTFEFPPADQAKTTTKLENQASEFPPVNQTDSTATAIPKIYISSFQNQTSEFPPMDQTKTILHLGTQTQEFPIAKIADKMIKKMNELAENFIAFFTRENLKEKGKIVAGLMTVYILTPFPMLI